MPFAVCLVPVMPLRALPDHKSEQISQLLFGECMEVTEQRSDGWARVCNRFDTYEGWASQSHLSPVREAFFESEPEGFTGQLLNRILLNGVPMHVPLGCPLKDFSSGKAVWGESELVYNGDLISPVSGPSAALIREFAFLYLNTAYLWGGRSNFGIDCSGFSQSVYRLLGHYLPRDAWQQAEEGEQIASLADAGCGDLAFFDNAEGRVTHVGILLNSREIIHSSGKVRVDKIDATGIFQVDPGSYSHHLKTIKRFFLK